MYIDSGSVPDSHDATGTKKTHLTTICVQRRANTGDGAPGASAADNNVATKMTIFPLSYIRTDVFSAYTGIFDDDWHRTIILTFTDFKNTEFLTV